MPLVIGEISEQSVRDDAGIVDQNVHPAERLGRRGDYGGGTFCVRDAMSVGNSRPAGTNDLVDDSLRDTDINAVSTRFDTEIVDNDVRSASSELQRVVATEAATRPGDDDDLTVETHFGSIVIHSGVLLFSIVVVLRDGTAVGPELGAPIETHRFLGRSPVRHVLDRGSLPSEARRERRYRPPHAVCDCS